MRLGSIGKIELTPDYKGSKISFHTDEQVWPSQFVKFTYRDKEYFYKISNVKITGHLLEVEAFECGYYNKISVSKKIDIRSIIHLDVELITDKEEISKVISETLLC